MFINCVDKVSHTGIAFCQDEYTVRSLSSQLKYNLQVTFWHEKEELQFPFLMPHYLLKKN